MASKDIHTNARQRIVGLTDELAREIVLLDAREHAGLLLMMFEAYENEREDLAVRHPIGNPMSARMVLNKVRVGLWARLKAGRW